MTKILEVIKPFNTLEIGDTLELSEDGKMYTHEYANGNSEVNDFGSSFNSEYRSVFSISVAYANKLIQDGYLREYSDDQGSKGFVNVFDEIDDMLETYTDELNEIDETCANLPACLKVEKETVMRNIIAVLSHLKSLKK